jgi:signal peptidase I
MLRRTARIAIDLALILAVITVGFIAYGLVGNRWYHIVSIASGSMEPSLATGSLAVITPPPQRVQPGMVITFAGDGRLVTHRVVEVRPDGFPVTQGDANTTPDKFDKVTVVGQVQFTIPLLGFVLPQAAASGAIFSTTLVGSQEIRVVGPFAEPTPTPTPAVPPTPSECAGTTFSQVIVGTEGNDVIHAGNWGALVFGLGGDDIIFGGNSKDCLVGGGGNDTLVGGNGKDVLLGGEGNDTLHGGGDGDVIQGGNGKDLIDGGDGIDACYGTSKDVFVGCETVAEGGSTPVPAPVDMAPPTAEEPSGGNPLPTTEPMLGRTVPVPEPTPTIEPTPALAPVDPTPTIEPTPALAPVDPTPTIEPTPALAPVEPTPTIEPTPALAPVEPTPTSTPVSTPSPALEPTPTPAATT